LRYKELVDDITERLRNLVKDKRADSKANTPALVGMDYAKALELVGTLAGLIPERDIKSEAVEEQTTLTDTVVGDIQAPLRRVG
jgi:hypothetical protein